MIHKRTLPQYYPVEMSSNRGQYGSEYPNRGFPPTYSSDEGNYSTPSGYPEPNYPESNYRGTNLGGSNFGPDGYSSFSLDSPNVDSGNQVRTSYSVDQGGTDYLEDQGPEGNNYEGHERKIRNLSRTPSPFPPREKSIKEQIHNLEIALGFLIDQVPNSYQRIDANLETINNALTKYDQLAKNITERFDELKEPLSEIGLELKNGMSVIGNNETKIKELGEQIQTLGTGMEKMHQDLNKTEQLNRIESNSPKQNPAEIANLIQSDLTNSIITLIDKRMQEWYTQVQTMIHQSIQSSLTNIYEEIRRLKQEIVGSPINQRDNYTQTKLEPGSSKLNPKPFPPPQKQPRTSPSPSPQTQERATVTPPILSRPVPASQPNH